MKKDRIRNTRSLFLAFAFLPALGGCGVGFDPNPKGVAAPSVSPPAAATPGCTTTVLARGIKNAAAANARGIYSDIRMVPGTVNPALAYTDPGHLRFAYWNGTQYQLEAVAADAATAASYVRLAFLSNGLPWVFWVSGTSVKAAVRSAPVGSPGTWASGSIATGVAPRAIEVAVSPANQIGVAYLTDNAITGRPNFLYCDNGCTSLAGFSTAGMIHNANIVGTQTGMGLGWCSAGGGTYYPAATYALSAPQTMYAVCTNPLSGCLSPAGWTPQQVSGLSTTITKLLLDPSAANDTPRVLLQNTGLTTYKMGSGCSAVSAFTSGSTLGTAATGSLWISFLLDPTGKMHLVANSGIVGISYLNSITNDVLGAWNSVGSVESISLLASHGGGATIDAQSGVVYAAYPMNNVPFNLHMARLDYSQASTGVIPHFGYPDSSGGVQYTAAAAQKKNVSAARTRAGRPAAVFVDYSNQTPGAPMQMAYRTGPNASDAWKISPVPVSISADFPSLAYDDKDLPWIAYFDNVFNKFYLAHGSATDGSGPWTVHDFPSQPSGPAAGLPSANNTALVMATLGGVTYPVMIVIDSNVTSKGVRAARLNPATGAWTAGLTIGTLGASTGAHLAADADKSGNIAVAYQDFTATQVMFLASTNAGTSWSTPVSLAAIATGSTGVSVRFNPVTGRPALTYFDSIAGFVYYNACGASLASCAASSGPWSPTAVESAAGLGGLPGASGQLISTSLNFSDLGFAQVTYPRGVNGSDGNLMHSTNVTGPFVSSVHASGAGGAHSTANPLNFAVAGWEVSSVINAAGGLTSVYVGPGNWITATSCGD